MTDPINNVSLDDFLDDNAQVHVIQQGRTTVVLTKLDRDMLVDYLRRLADEIASRLDTDDQSDIIAAKEIRQNEDSIWGALLLEEVF